MAQLTSATKQRLVEEAQTHIRQLGDRLEDKIKHYSAKIAQLRETIPQLDTTDIFSLDPDSVELEILIAKIKMYTSFIEEAKTIQSSPYFLRLDVINQETQQKETIFISKYQQKEENIFSWVAPIATLRFSEPGKASYQRPDGSQKHFVLTRKDNYLITNAEIVFMTYQDRSAARQVVHQKHFAERRDFLLPEIVAELDRLQDQIIRSDPKGHFLISGPAGSGKTTLALHRIAYLVLTPEFKDFFTTDRIIVFVSNQKDIRYFSQLLPELGINDVRVTTFMEWGTMIVNSRFRAKLNQRFVAQPLAAALEHIQVHNPYPSLDPRIILDEYRRLKQQMIMRLNLKEGSQTDVYPGLHSLFTSSLDQVDQPLKQEFLAYLAFQKKHKYLDETDITVLLKSLTNPVQPFAHMVIDEVQNWTPAQLQIITNFAHQGYKSVTFIGDIQQKTKVYTISEWAEISAEFGQQTPRQVELLKVYRNTRQILSYLGQKGYSVNLDNNTKQGPEVKKVHLDPNTDLGIKLRELISVIESEQGKVQIAIIGRYPSSLSGVSSLGYSEEGESNVHVLTAESAQGLEFHTVIIINSHEFHPNHDELLERLGLYAANEYEQQAKHLFYVAATRAQNQLVVIE